MLVEIRLREMKNSIKKFIKDLTPVLLGVLIALWLNNWNERRKDQIFIENFYRSLKKEFKDADMEIDEKIPLQQKLIDSLNVYSNNQETSLIQVIEKGGGFTGPLIRLNYWNALSKSKIELINYKKIAILSNIDEGNKLLKYKQNKILDFIYSNLTEKGKKQKVLLKIMITELINTQRNIQNEIQQILNE